MISPSSRSNRRTLSSKASRTSSRACWSHAKCARTTSENETFVPSSITKREFRSPYRRNQRFAGVREVLLADRRLADDDRLGRVLGGVGRDRRDLRDHVVALGHLAQQRVVGRKAGVGGGDDEELAARRACRLDLGLRHRDDAARVA